MGRAGGACADYGDQWFVPGSKSETNRALILAALASGPSVISGGLEARDTQLMRDALRTLGVDIVEGNGEWQITPPKTFVAGGTIDCGLAGTVMRFVPPIAALADGTVRFDGDQQAYARPMGPMLGALERSAPRSTASRFRSTITGNPQLRGATSSSTPPGPASSSAACCSPAPGTRTASTSGTSDLKSPPGPTSR